MWKNIKALCENPLNMSMSILVADSDLITHDHVIMTSTVYHYGVIEEVL